MSKGPGEKTSALAHDLSCGTNSYQHLRELFLRKIPLDSIAVGRINACIAFAFKGLVLILLNKRGMKHYYKHELPYLYLVFGTCSLFYW